MLYPRVYINRKENKVIEKLDCVKESLFSLLRAFRNHNLFILFLKQKFHF